MATGPSLRALEVARLEAAALIKRGATAVVLTGSHARGDAHPESDLDIRGVGEKLPKTLRRRDEFLVSVSVSTKQEVNEAFNDPGEVGEFVPGWRDAVVLEDPDGVAEGFKRHATGWSWDDLDETANQWIADQMVSQAEEVHTLVGNIDQGQATGAAAIRSQIVGGLAKLLAVRRRILYGSENDLWDLVAKHMGARYRQLQEVALGVSAGTFSESCRATLELFRVATDDVWPLLDTRQRAIIGHARHLSEASR